jgi:hypothetical protein
MLPPEQPSKPTDLPQMTDRIIGSEMPIPKPKGQIIGAWIFTAFILFFVILALSNLVNSDAIVYSIIWLLLVAGVIWSFCRDEGIRRFLVNLLGNFASKHFAQSISADEHHAEIRFGYQFLGHRFFYMAIPIDKIETVEWSTGQATDLAGREMNDWHVVLWFDHDDPARSQKQQMLGKPDQDVYIVGPHGSREKTAAYGQSFLDFLRQAGATLVPGENECSFVRTPVETEEQEDENPDNHDEPAVR